MTSSGEQMAPTDARGLGRCCWVIAEGYIPPPGPYAADRSLRSHETACLLNTNDVPAHVNVLIYFTDRDPIGPFRVVVEPQRTVHLRFDDLNNPQPIPRETDFASVIQADVPIVVQHTRLDVRLGNLTLMSTVPFSVD